jgi:hypothetical protein
MTTEDLTGMGKAVAPLTEGVSRLCSKLLSKPADEGGDILTEWIDVQFRPWRLKNLLRSLEKTNEILVQYGAEPRPISNHKLLSEFFNGASLEVDETLQQLWAGLLATALQGRETHPAYPGILKQIASSEAKILNVLFLNGAKASRSIPEGLARTTVPLDSLLTQDSMTETTLLISTENLCRLNLCTLEPKKSYAELLEESVNSPSFVPLNTPVFLVPHYFV